MRSNNLTSEWKEIPPSGLKAVCQQVEVIESSEVNTWVVDQLGVSLKPIPDCYAFLARLELGPLEQLSKRDLQRAQEVDPVIGEVGRAVRGGCSPQLVKNTHPDIKLLLREWEKLVLKDSLLYGVTKRTNWMEIQQLVLPSKYRMVVLQVMHVELAP